MKPELAACDDFFTAVGNFVTIGRPATNLKTQEST